MIEAACEPLGARAAWPASPGNRAWRRGCGPAARAPGRGPTPRLVPSRPRAGARPAGATARPLRCAPGTVSASETVKAPSVVSHEFWHFLSSPCASMQAPQSRPGASLSLRPGAASGPATPTPDGTSPAGRYAPSGPCSVRGVVRREYREYWQGPQRGSLLARGALALPADGSGAHGELPKGASRGARGETPRMWIGACGGVAPLGNGAHHSLRGRATATLAWRGHQTPWDALMRQNSCDTTLGPRS